MQNKYVKQVFQLCLVLFAQVLFSGGSKYQGVFTRELYRQSDVMSEFKPKAASDTTQYQEELNVFLVNKFVEKKCQQIDQRIARGLMHKIEILESTKDSFKTAFGKREKIGDRRWWQRFFDALGPLVEGRFGSAVGTVAGTSDAAQERKTSSLDALIRQIEEESEGSLAIEDLKVQREKWLSEFEAECWHPLEISYIKKKRFMHRALQNFVETNFISARGSEGVSTVKFQAAINEALALPRFSKRLGKGDTVEKCVRDVAKKLEGNPLFANYGPEVQQELRQLATTLVYLSHGKPDTERPYMRRGFYFWGPPLSGKSYAAQLLQETLDLPICEKCLYSSEQLSKENLEGSEFWSSQARMGWLAEALTTKASNGKTYKNIVLVINDLDRMCLGANNIPEAFLLDYLDPKKREFISPYFGGAPIDISGVTIIGTGNMPLYTPSTRSLSIPRFSPTSFKTTLAYSLPVLSSLFAAVLVKATSLSKHSRVMLSAASIPMLLALNSMLIGHETELAQQSRGKITISDPGAIARRLKQIHFDEFASAPEHDNPKQRILTQDLKKRLALYSLTVDMQTHNTLLQKAMKTPSMTDALLTLDQEVNAYLQGRIKK